MKRMTNLCAALCAVTILGSGSSFAATDAKGFTVETSLPGRAKPMTEEQREAMLKRTGGPVLSPERGPWIAIVNCQKTIATQDLAEEVEYLRKVFKVPVHEITATGDAVAAAKAELAAGAAIAVSIVDIAGTPSATMAPSDQYGILNVAPLVADANPALARERFHRELLRCAAYSFGLGNTAGRLCILKPIRSVTELDALEGRNLGPEALGAIMRIIRERGMEQQRLVPYRRAVQEGWAQPPTNDYQRAIWDEIHSATNATSNAAAKAAE